MYINVFLPHAPPLSIPDHSRGPKKKFTIKGILQQMDAVLFQLEEIEETRINRGKREEQHGTGGGREGK
jgi:hypothetical protein